MGINVTVKEEEETKKDLPFPKLMIARNGDLVLMLSVNGSDGDGVCLKGHKIHHDTCWSIENFADYPHPITLQNEP